jgi:hypothetical protein
MIREMVDCSDEGNMLLRGAVLYIEIEPLKSLRLADYRRTRILASRLTKGISKIELLLPTVIMSTFENKIQPQPSADGSLVGRRNGTKRNNDIIGCKLKKQS